MPLGIFRRFKRGKTNEDNLPSHELPTGPLTIITNQRPPHYRTSTDQEYDFNAEGIAEKENSPASRAQLSRRYLALGRRSLSNGDNQHRIVESSAETGISILTRDGLMPKAESSATRDVKGQRPVSYYDIGRSHRLVSRRVSGSTRRSEYQPRSVSDGSRLSGYGSIRQNTSGTEVVNRSVNVVTHALRALKVRSVDMLHPKPTLRFEYEPVDNTLIPIDPFTSGDMLGLRRSQVRSLHVDDMVDDMDSHAIRVALERDARRSLDTRRSISNSNNHTHENSMPLDERAEPGSGGARKLWPWRDSRELIDRDRERIIQGNSRRQSQNSQRYDEMLQDPELLMSENAEDISPLEPCSIGYSLAADPHLEGDYLPDEPTLISSQGLRHQETDMRTTTDYELRGQSDFDYSRGGQKGKDNPSSGYLLTAAWTSFLKRATAERIRREIEVRESADERTQNQIWRDRKEFSPRGSLSGDSCYSRDSQEFNDDIQYVSEDPAVNTLNSTSGAESGLKSPTRRRRQYEDDVEPHYISKEQHQDSPVGEHYIYDSAVTSRRARHVRQEELNEGYKAEIVS
ncbi:hypothetical protein V1508DRAFT_29364 [Lipomyces doorenjongii]|uniref:uncharacterized protein n=1 Tax=Lipomyces doorenjongii TaxID=383834 RepID=UPI0034CD62A8